MKLSEKIDLFKNLNNETWTKTLKEVEDELSSKQSFVCVCGRLATGFHEMNCRRFRNKVVSETVKRLQALKKAGAL